MNLGIGDSGRVAAPVCKHATAKGFTLVELVVVIGLIAVVMAIALPELLPMIAVGRHEGAARHLANYGRTAIAHAALTHTQLTLKVDLDRQMYWCEVWPEPVVQEEEAGSRLLRNKEDDEDEIPKDQVELLKRAQEELGKEPDETDQKLVDEQTQQMTDNFERMMRQAIVAKASRVVHDIENILDERGPMFEDRLSLDKDSDEIEPEEVTTPLLLRTRLPSETYIDTVRVGEEQYRKGIVEIEISPLGLEKPIGFYVVNDDGDQFTVEWDPITGGAHLRSGREAFQ